MDISMDISTPDISRGSIPMDISNRYIFFGYIRYPYIHGYIRYIQLHPKKIYLFSDISKKIYLFLDIVKMDITGYIQNGCIQKGISGTDISKQDISRYIHYGYIQKICIHYVLSKKYVSMFPNEL